MTGNEFYAESEDRKAWRLKNRFQVFDKDGSGKVSANELRHVLTQLGEKLDSKDCDKLLDGHEDADGNVKYDHFIKTILSDKEEAKE